MGVSNFNVCSTRHHRYPRSCSLIIILLLSLPKTSISQVSFTLSGPSNILFRPARRSRRAVNRAYRSRFQPSREREFLNLCDLIWKCISGSPGEYILFPLVTRVINRTQIYANIATHSTPALYSSLCSLRLIMHRD